MRKYFYGLGALVVPTLVGAMVTSGCGEDGDGGGLIPGGDDICGPCGTIATGDVGISGDARLDGFFKALGTMQNTTAFVQADFDANIRALGDTFGVTLPAGAINAAAVGQLTAAIRAEITANVQGGITVDYQPPQCQASVNVAFEAQAKCEAKGGCEVDVDPGELSVSCEGTCTGGCSAGCTGDFSCEVEAPSVACEGRCEGACAIEGSATCEGTCRGTCAGTCSAQDSTGQCAGTCDGMCTGTCELAVAASCNGTCSGKCLVNQGSASCTGDVSCRGECSGSCTGGCEGTFTPPSASAMCDATVDCQASAKAEANASLDCTPPQLKVDYTFAAGIAADAEAKAEFTAKITELRTRGVAILQGAAKYEALLTGEVEGRVVFEPSPLAQLQASMTALATPSAVARFDIPVGKLSCVVPAFVEAGRVAASLATGTTTTLQAQASFVTAFTGGFGA